MSPRFTLIALACLAVMAPAHSQTTPAPAGAEVAKRVEITGSRIKRTDAETPSAVQVITAEEIQRAGYSTVDELLRATSLVDVNSISDGQQSGFVSGISTISMRGFGSQGTLILINGRRTAPVAAVDINFGRGSLISVNTLPIGSIERIEILKDGASAIYGSDAMAGVVNFILKKEFTGLSVATTLTANTDGVGATKNGSISFGFGNLERQRFNIYGGLEVSKRDAVMHSELKNQGNLASFDKYLEIGGGIPNFTPNSVAALNGNYYRLPTSLAGTTVLNGVSVANNSVFGVNFLGALPGCPDANTVGKGVLPRLPNFTATTASFPIGMCRFNLDNATQAISAQDRVAASMRATFRISPTWTAYADLMASETKTTQTNAPYTMSTTLATSLNPNIVTWPLANGTFANRSVIVLPVGPPDNPTNGTASSQPIQLIYRFEDMPQLDISTLKSTRLTAGLEGTWGAWDIDTAFLFSRQDNTSNRTNRLRSSLLTSAIASNSYRFGKVNNAAAIATIASDSITEGNSEMAQIDVRASRELFKMKGGMAAIAIGGEHRREKLSATPSDLLKSGDFIGLVGNSTSGSRNSTAGYAEARLPVLKDVELQTAIRAEKYSDFGDSTTGKLGFKWNFMPSVAAIRGTVATGFRAPSIAQISNAFLLSFHTSQDARVFDPIRCNSTNPAAPVSRSNPPNIRDCNVLGFSTVPSGQNPGSLATVISGNPNVKPEESKSATFGVIFSPNKDIDLGIDWWYFRRDNEIRVQRGFDIMAAYTANQAANTQFVQRDANPTTWLPGVPNSGPIVGLTRGYGNFNFTRVSGIDYDLTWRLPRTDIGRFTILIDGTYTNFLDDKVLTTDPVANRIGLSSFSMPKTKARAQLRFDRGNWSSFVRYNHNDNLTRTGDFTATCVLGATPANAYLVDNNGCGVSKGATVDLGVTYKGIKNLTLSGTVLNAGNNYGPASLIPSSFTYWDNGTQGMLGRRVTVNAQYKFW